MTYFSTQRDNSESTQLIVNTIQMTQTIKAFSISQDDNDNLSVIEHSLSNIFSETIYLY